MDINAVVNSLSWRRIALNDGREFKSAPAPQTMSIKDFEALHGQVVQRTVRTLSTGTWKGLQRKITTECLAGGSR